MKKKGCTNPQASLIPSKWPKCFARMELVELDETNTSKHQMTKLENLHMEKAYKIASSQYWFFLKKKAKLTQPLIDYVLMSWVNVYAKRKNTGKRLLRSQVKECWIIYFYRLITCKAIWSKQYFTTDLDFPVPKPAF